MNFSTCDLSLPLLYCLALVLEDFTILRICPFLLGYPFYWHRVSCVRLLWSFVFLPCLLHLLFDFLLYWFESSLFWSQAKGLSILLIFLMKQLLVSLIFSIFFVCSYIFFYALIFMIYFLLLNLGFICSFSGSIRCKIRLFIWDFCFLR